MKVRELIKQLEVVDGDLNVYVRGYEGGVDDVCNIGKPVDVALNVNDAWYYGKHEVIDEGYNEYDGYDEAKGIII